MRLFIELKALDQENGLYFQPFTEDLILREVIAGADCDVSRARLAEALGDLGSSVRMMKAQLAFRSFKVVKQRNAALWT